MTRWWAAFPGKRPASGRFHLTRSNRAVRRLYRSDRETGGLLEMVYDSWAMHRFPVCIRRAR